jgi:hypothetical protein
MRAPSATNAAFYSAFNARDIDAMDAVWARTKHVSCAHPGKTAIIGRAAVMQSWREILEVPAATPVMERPRLVRVTDDVTMVLCLERLGRICYTATNVFVLEDDEWRMAHHHAGPTLDAGS